MGLPAGLNINTFIFTSYSMLEFQNTKGILTRFSTETREYLYERQTSKTSIYHRGEEWELVAAYEVFK
jgi:hypothetical protein